MEARLFGEIDAAIFGDEESRERALPRRHWRMGPGGWQSHDRERCIPEYNCEYIVMPEAKDGD